MSASLQPDGPTIAGSEIIAFALGMMIGYGVWAAAPAAIGHRAPWDGSWPYYSTVLVGASILVALVVPRQYAVVFIGTALGQLLAALRLLDASGRTLLDLRYDWIGAVLTFPGTWAGSALRDRLRRAG